LTLFSYFNRLEKKKFAHTRQKLLILLFKNVLKISNFEKSAKTSKNLEKPLKNSEKKLQISFCLGAFMREGKMSVIKIACFMLIFLNLKSKPRHLFFWVESSLSILCSCYCYQNTVLKKRMSGIQLSV
jgi:hypothetical protein